MTTVAAALAGVAERFREPLRALLAGELPVNVALMRLLAEAEDPGEAECALAGVAGRTFAALAADTQARERLEQRTRNRAAQLQRAADALAADAAALLENLGGDDDIEP